MEVATEVVASVSSVAPKWPEKVLEDFSFGVVIINGNRGGMDLVVFSRTGDSVGASFVLNLGGFTVDLGSYAPHLYSLLILNFSYLNSAF